MKINLEDIKLLSANIQSFRLCHVLEIEKYIKKKTIATYAHISEMCLSFYILPVMLSRMAALRGEDQIFSSPTQSITRK
jgi:hypothetical protein